MRARLARRLVVPLLVAVAALFLILGFVAVSVAERSVQRDFAARADRAAATLNALALPREHRGTILAAMSDLSGLAYTLGDQSTLQDAISFRDDTPVVTADGDSFRWLRRDLEAKGETLYVLARESELRQRRRDALTPIGVAGALGLVLALAVGLWVARLVAQPVRELADSVQGFAKGEFTGSFRARGPGEIGELQDAFVAMTNEIERQQNKVRESERFATLGRLAGGIAHELRNPLTAIRMAVETALDGNDEASGNVRSEARAVAVAEVDRLDRTLRELLHYVAPRPLTLQSIDVGPLFEEVSALLGPQCRHLKVELRIDAGMDGLSVRGDRDRLKQALINLVLNGAQAQPRGGFVELRARPHVWEVADGGAGIRDEIKDTLLQPFATTKAAGIGLGLAVVDQVAQEHAAELTFETGPDGTTFRLTFGPTATSA